MASTTIRNYPSKSMSRDLSDLSTLLFEGIYSGDPHVGPVLLTKVSTHGRGLIAARDVRAGECLVVIPPILEARVADVRSKWEPSTCLEELSEQSLLQRMKEALRQPEESAIVASFLSLVGSSHSDGSCLSVDRLLGMDKDRFTIPQSVSDEELLQIIRKTHLGPISLPIL